MINRRSLAEHFQPRALGIVLVAALLSLPVVVVLSFVFHPAGEVWRHLADTVLPTYARNSALLMVGVAIGTLALGVTTAWLTTMCTFAGRKVFEWALLLPLAIPAYIIAYTYTGMLDFAGPVQTFLRDLFGWSRGDYWFPEIRSLGGAMVMLSLVLYPYVYLLARSAFLEQSPYAIDVSRTLGCSTWSSFFRVSLPAARPAIVAGLSLAMMETLADFGTVQYFGVPTFTTGIFRTWFGLGDSGAAAQLSVVLLAFIFFVFAAERWSRNRASFHHVGNRSRPLGTYHLSRGRAWLAFSVCALTLAFGFLVPVAQLSVWAVRTASEMVDASFIALLVHTLALAAATAAISVLLALYLAYGRRAHAALPVRFAVRLAGLGYAVPGIVIAVGVMLPLAWLDNAVDAWLRRHFEISSGLILSGTLVALMLAYQVRFLAVSLQTVESGLAKITPVIDEAGRSLGCRVSELVRRVHVPMLRGSLLTASLLVFVDVMKELPATLVLRPFDFNTLAVRAYELATDERLEDASTAALSIVAAGLVPVILLSLSIARSRYRETLEVPYQPLPAVVGQKV